MTNNTKYDIFKAIENGDRANVASLLAQDTQIVNLKDSSGRIPLVVAVSCGKYQIIPKNQELRIHSIRENASMEIVKLLIEYGSDINAKDNEELTPLMVPLFNWGRKHPVVDLLLQNGALLGKEILNAVIKCDFDTIRHMVMEKPELLNCKYDPENINLLILAILLANEEMVKFLISMGAEVNAHVSIYTPLMKACGLGYLKLVELLVSKGADVNGKSRAGFMPLHTAAQYGHKEIVEYLIANGADVNANDVCQTALHYAVWCNHTDIAELLISQGADINARGRDNITPLHKAAAKADRNMMRLFIRHRANLNIIDYRGRAPLDIAIKNKNEDATKFLCRNGAKIWRHDKDSLKKHSKA
jgi:ankyrin repeat protein